MIQKTKGKLIQHVLDGRPRKGFPSNIFERATDLLALLDAVIDLEDLRSPPGNNLEKLTGDRKGQHSIRINKQWRFCFIWTPSGPTNVELTDYH